MTWQTTGIDVSSYQSTADYASILQYMEFAFAKATEGTAPDGLFNAHIGYFQSHQVPIIGGYHFGRDDVNIAAQLKAYLARAGTLEAHFLDVEGAHFLTAAQGRYFVDGMHAAGHHVGLYASESKWPLRWGQDWDFVANYTREPRVHYDVWQFGPAATNVDGDRSPHTLDELRSLMEPGGVNPPMPIPTPEDPVNLVPGLGYVTDIVVTAAGTQVLDAAHGQPVYVTKTANEHFPEIGDDGSYHIVRLAGDKAGYIAHGSTGPTVPRPPFGDTTHDVRLTVDGIEKAKVIV